MSQMVTPAGFQSPPKVNDMSLVPSGLKNFFLMFNRFQLGHKPALIVAHHNPQPGDAVVQGDLQHAPAEDEVPLHGRGVAGAVAQEDAVGPTFGAEITRAAIEALVVFLLVVMAFITWRLEWKMAVAAIAALFHDLIITAGLYSIIGFEVTPATVVAILTILGYSLYDTVVVFDRIRENFLKMRGIDAFESMNVSVSWISTFGSLSLSCLMYQPVLSRDRVTITSSAGLTKAPSRPLGAASRGFTVTSRCGASFLA